MRVIRLTDTESEMPTRLWVPVMKGKPLYESMRSAPSSFIDGARFGFIVGAASRATNVSAHARVRRFTTK